MDIINYEERSPQVTAVDNGWIRAFVGDDIPRIGDAVALRSEGGDEVFAAVRRHTGARGIDAMLLATPEWVRPGVEVVPTGKAARISAPTQGRTSLQDLALSAGEADSASIELRLRAPSFNELRGSHPALETGFSAIDRLAPLAGGGLNLILDMFPGTTAYVALAGTMRQATDFDAILWLSGDDSAPEWTTHHIAAGGGAQRQLTALRVLMSWACRLRDQGEDVLVGAELPPLSAHDGVDQVDSALGVSIGGVVDQLGSTLTSTDTGTITTLLRLPLHTSPAGIEHIIETMDVGDVDAQIYIDDQGQFDPYRSSSDADLDADARSEQQALLSVLSRAAAARDKAAMMGEFGLDEGEQAALERAELLNESLAR